MTYSCNEAIEMMNRYGVLKKPFLFIISYDKRCNHIIPLEEVNPEQILYDFNGVSNIPSSLECGCPSRITWDKEPISLNDYKTRFDKVIHHLKRGDSFLTNLTARTPISTNIGLRDLFLLSQAKYRIWMKNNFCSLSPEIFIRINGNTISSYPMKGTIDATVPDAEQKIMEDEKEAAEHATIVDLIRNDLSMHAKEVTVSRYRYIDRLETNQHSLLQVSSEIRGTLKRDFAESLGELLYSMLPAGSICGAPKRKTLEVIGDAEKESRGYYTGVAGIFDGENLDSGVLIRFIEQQEDGSLHFRSGGGITAKSNLENEYQELIQKVYVPICRNDQDQSSERS